MNRYAFDYRQGEWERTLNGSSLEVSAMDSIKFPRKSCSWQASVPPSAAIFNLKVKTKKP
jgi:hypothetical protein